MASFICALPLITRRAPPSSVSLATDLRHNRTSFTSFRSLATHRRRALLRHIHFNPVTSTLSDNNKNDSNDTFSRPRFDPNQPLPDEETIKQQIISSDKGEQQKGLIYVRSLAPEKALELYLLCLKTTNNEFIRATVAVAIGELDLPALSEEKRNSAINLLIDMLATAEDYGVRSAAAAGMGYATSVLQHNVQQYVAMVESLSRALLEEADWQVQFSCIASLGALGRSDSEGTHFDVCAVLTPWLDSSNDLIIQATVGALGDIGNVKVLPSLLQILGNSDMMTRQRLAQALGNIDGCVSEPSAIDALRTLSTDQSFVVRQAAKDALESFGVDISNIDNGSGATSNDQSDIGDELDQLVEELKQGLDSIGDSFDMDSTSEAESKQTNEEKKGDSNEEDLITKEVENLMKGNETGNAVESASDALRRRLERSFNTASPSENSHPSLRNPTSFDYRSILTPGDDSVNPSSQKGNQKQSGDTSDETEVELSTNKEALAEVVSKIENGDDKEKLLAVIELRKFDKTMARDVIVDKDLLNVYNNPFRLRSLCVPVVGRAGDVDLLVQTLRNDPEENVRSACIDSLTDAIERNDSAKNVDTVVDACIGCLKDDDHWLVRISAAIALGSLGKGVARVEDALIECMVEDSELQPVQASTVQRHVITALGFVGSPKAVSLFEDVLRSEASGTTSRYGFVDPAMRYRIAAALSGIETQESLELAKKLANDEKKFVAEMAQGSVDALKKKGLK